MNILFISEHLPYFPCYDGFRLIPYNLLKELHNKHTFHIIALSTNADDTKHEEQLRGLCSSLEIIYCKQEHRIFKKIKTLFSRYSWNTEIFSKIKSALQKYEIDLIHVEGAHIFQYVQGFKNAPRIICPHDSPAARAYSLLKIKNTLLKKTKIFIDWIKSINYEKNVYSCADHCVVVSPSDKIVIQRHCPNLKISVVSNGIDTSYYAFKLRKVANRQLIFTGNMSYPPNIDAVLYFCKNIFPLIKQQLADIKFYVVGATPSKEIIKLGKDNSIIVTGQVDDIRPYIYESTVYVCPMKSGTGIKNKILEAMATGIPIVATKMSTIGINVTNNKDILIEDNPIEFSNKIMELLTNDEKRFKFANEARRLVTTKYSWTSMANHIEQIMLTLKTKPIN